MFVAYRPFDVTLARREQLSPSFVRITLTGDDLGQCADTLLDQRVKLILGQDQSLDALLAQDDWYSTMRAMADDVRPVLRTYTLSGVRQERREVDIDVVVHGDAEGPASRFAVEAEQGTRLGLVAAVHGAQGADEIGVAWHPGTAREICVAADETAVPAALNIAATIAPPVHATVLLEVPRADDIRPVAAREGVDVRWFARERGERAVSALPFPCSEAGDGPAEPPEGEALWDEATGVDRYLWVAGEMSWVRTIRRAARAAGVAREESSFMGYWRRGGPID